MAGIQVGGIVSGMDTNALVDQLIEQAQIPVDKLYGEYSYTQLEEEVYDDFNDKLGNLSSDLLTLRLESTFKTKSTSSTNESVATATANTDASVGTHTVQVDQLASHAVAGSSYTRFSLSQAGSTVTKVTGLSSDYLQGVNTTVVEQSGADYMATTELKLNNLGKIQKQQGADIDAAYVDSYGVLLQDIAGDFTITYTDMDGNDQAITLNGTWGDSSFTPTQTIGDVAARLEFYMNEGMNNSMGTNAVQYLSIRAEYEDDGSWNMAIYETTIDDYNISVGGTDAGTLRDELGFAEAYTPTTSTTNTITKYHRADNIDDFQDRVFSSVSGVVGGASYTLTGAITEGTFVIAQDSSLNVSSDTNSYYTSAQVSGGAGLDVTAKGLDAAGFTEIIDDNANGFFTINDVKITIEDYTSLSVNDLLGIINASGAGVTASYDSITDTFEIMSNKSGSTKISLGNLNDTSDLLSKMKLSSTDRTFSQGSTAGSINTTLDLQNAGLTVYPYSGTFTINGVSIYVDTGVDTIQDLIEKVNSSGAGVTMSYDSTSDKVSLRSEGIDAIEVGSANDTSNILVALNLTDNPIVTKTIGSEGRNAILTVDGETYIRESNEVDDIINGVTLTLNSADPVATTINVNVDTEKAVDAFATFISHYNEVMEALKIPEYNKKDKEKYMTYLTETKKSSMSDSEIEKYMENYEYYNKNDIIRRSTELKNMDSTMRRLFFGVRPTVTGSINDMSDLGIKIAGAGDLDTELYGYLVELTTDKDEIKEALNDNKRFIEALREQPDSVFEFFSKNSDLEKDDPNYEADLGWARYYSRMINNRYTSTEGMIGGKLGNNGSIYTELNRLESRITTQEDRVDKQLERYWAQFTAMEKAIADAQAQSADFSKASG